MVTRAQVEQNRALMDQLLSKRMESLRAPHLLSPWLFKPCRSRVLLITDGALDFSYDNFGLSTFVEILATQPLPFVEFEITVGHRDSSVTGGEGNPNISRNIGQFRFDNQDHFDPTRFDQVWLFGFGSSYRTDFTPPADELASRNQWAQRPSEAELRVLAQFMNGGGGLFATGDHGALGSAMGGFLPRARSMRRWFYPGPGPFNELSATEMTASTRHDTNQLGHDTDSQFDDQSDDVPQPIAPRMYSRKWALQWLSWPHPLLCGTKGPIKILPDHPHEGECTPPHEVDRIFHFEGFEIEEYPRDALGNRVLPEVIATSQVLPGLTATTFGSKSPTNAHSFGAISAYDGNRAGVGRVVTDATWHHFVNINLVGDKGVATSDPKYYGFLASASGQAHFEVIKTYYLNIAKWIARPSTRRCMRKRAIWYSTWSDLLLESVTAGTPQSIEKLKFPELILIGGHARDVLGRFAGRCLVIEWLVELIRPNLIDEFIPVIDPWGELPREMEDSSTGISNPSVVLDAALGALVVSLRQQFPTLRDAEKAMVRDEVENRFDEIAKESLSHAVRQTNRAFEREHKLLSNLLRRD